MMICVSGWPSYITVEILGEEIHIDGFIDCMFVVHIVLCSFCLPYNW